ncbi:MAG: immune inhibitor A [Candidatus Poseidoniaceae archaeon]|nr:immune inhibitor A [Candidatus Poseidoniaceae archaeon]
MKGKWLGFPLIFLLLSAATFSFTNESVIEDWLKSNSIVVQSDEIDTLPIQNDEYWPVLIVDFNGRNTNSNTAISEAESMLIPNAKEYFLELSRGSVTVNIDIHTVMTTASGNLADYGSDYGVERDSSSDGTHLPMQLAEEVVLANKESFSWDKYDLNNDGIVDRLLILHTTIGQETGGNSNRIWSHFTTFEDYIELGEGLSIGHYAMASLGSGLEGFGTAMHEMLHQMGAYDLYPSDGQQTSVWKGVGDWDIMASGNWNDDGKTPALPMSSTLETIGLDNYENVVFNWVQEDDYCTANSIIFSSFDQNKLDYKIPISEGEYVWIEYREGNSYDDELPGNGVLVSYQDTTVSGYDDNELNVNNKRPYLKIIEADGNDELLSGSNEGQASDIFMNGTKFGSEGIEIRNHDGVLVDWYAEVIIQNQVEILFKSDSCVAEFSVDLPNYSITSLLNQPISFSAKSSVTCALDNQLTSTDGRLVSVSANQLIAGETTNLEIRFNSAAQHNSKTRLVGTLECGTEIVDLDIEVLSLSILPKNSSFSETIPVNSNSEVSIPIDTTGSGSHNFEYKIDGPLSRIADSQQILRLTGENDYLIIDIDPKELLTNNMIVNGVIEITDSNGNQWDIDVVLTAESSVTKSINDYISPSQMVGLACIFAALWIFLTMKDSAKDEIEELPKQYSVTETSFEQTPVDAWGRPIDD